MACMAGTRQCGTGWQWGPEGQGLGAEVSSLDFIRQAMGSQAGSLRMEDCQVLVTLRIPGQGAMNQPQQVDLWFEKTTPGARNLPQPSPQARPLLPSRVATGRLMGWRPAPS